MSGKTSLAKKFARQFKSQGIGVLVLDPLLDPEWNADFITADAQQFLDVAQKSQHCALFIDESGEAIGRHGGEMNKLATRIRHYGHRSFFIAQRAQQLDKIVRDQCEFLWLFRVSRGDAELMAEEYGHDALETAHSLQKGECFYAQRFKPLQKFDSFQGVAIPL